MQLVLNPDQFAQTRDALLGKNSSELIDLIFRLKLGRPVDGIPRHTLDQAARLQWTHATHPTLTELGGLVADPIREYRFWLDRDRKVHAEDHCDWLKPEHYKDKSVLEPGSGFGCNLFSFSRVSGRFVGLEPIALYRQFTPIFAAREGLNAPEVVDGTGESLPFPDAEFDIVLCYSAHQYMDIVPAINEMARVLRPGGQLQIIGGTLGSFTRGSVTALARKPKLGLLKQTVLTLANTMVYEALGRRIWIPGGASATTAPIYPSQRHMRRWMTAAGLRVRNDLVAHFGGESVLIADKPAGSRSSLPPAGH